MPRGGARPGAGRKKGQRNKRTVETIKRAAVGGLLPHEFLAAVAQGREFDGHKPSFQERMKAAADAAPYYAPRLQNTAHSGEMNITNDASAIPDHELADIARRSGAGAAAPPRGTSKPH